MSPAAALGRARPSRRPAPLPGRSACVCRSLRTPFRLGLLRRFGVDEAARLSRPREAPSMRSSGGSGGPLGERAAPRRGLAGCSLRRSPSSTASTSTHGGRGVILLGFAGEVESASPPTRRLLREFFPATSGGPLPAALAEWLESD